MIFFKNVKKNYDENTTINIENVKLESGNIYALLGPNGAGKTTIIRMLIGLLKPSDGEIYINNINIHKSFEYKKLIGYIPDEPNLYESLTGREFITFIANLYGYQNTDDLKRKINFYINEFNITDKADLLISTYSKGMKQKISIISTLIHEPQILILDEPFTGLDTITIKKLKDIIRNFVESKNNIVIFSTHDLDVASNLCTDIIIINKGTIIFDDKIINIPVSKSLEDSFFEILKNSNCRR